MAGLPSMLTAVLLHAAPSCIPAEVRTSVNRSVDEHEVWTVCSEPCLPVSFRGIQKLSAN